MDLLKHFETGDYKPIATLMNSGTYIDVDETGKCVDISKYQGMIGSLLYLTTSRPVIVFSVYLCTCYPSKPKESHLTAVKVILEYLKGILDVGLWYPKGSICNLVGYSNSDFAGCKYERKSTSDTCHILGNVLVS
ncbi:PREDICTED: uncharacterized protein LOC109352967 [Lupinus angustifolius]|uniref:uncharacterized protein LOC109352967 n=1 Tax=Lupinus angustifolius TaxID=3871 RepID=UPI00092F1891|nr:PREDICTED: uncharacterized protein LOC109352967 [Lupinus angustifolius]